MNHANLVTLSFLALLFSHQAFGKCMNIDESKLLADMYRDDYFPNHLVDKGKLILVTLCNEIEQANPKSAEEAYSFTHKATERFNLLQEEFEAEGSEIETAARESIAESVATILDATDIDYDLEEAIAPRDW